MAAVCPPLAPGPPAWAAVSLFGPLCMWIGYNQLSRNGSCTELPFQVSVTVRPAEAVTGRLRAEDQQGGRRREEEREAPPRPLTCVQ